jgi:adenylylsulfate kinase
MKPEIKNIVWQDTKVKKEDRQLMNKHKSCVLWLTGLSGSGKSTIAMELEKKLFELGIHTFILDGDNLRYGLNKNLGFSPEDRKENVIRIGEVSKLFVDAGIIVLTACISPYREDREMVRNMFGKNEFLEVYVKCSLEECERRDPKGLYQKAREGKINCFTGISAPYEEPLDPELLIESDRQLPIDAVNEIISYLNSNGYLRFQGK